MKFAKAFEIASTKNKILVSPYNDKIFIKDDNLYTTGNHLIHSLNGLDSNEWGYEDKKVSFTEAMRAFTNGKLIKSGMDYIYKSCPDTGDLLIQNDDTTWSTHCYFAESETRDKWVILDEQGR